MASETNMDYSYVTKQCNQGECKEFEKDIKVEIKEEIESESEEDNAVEIEIDIKEEKYDYSDSLQEDELDVADIKPSTLFAHNTLVKEEAQIILEKIDTETPARKRISNEVPQRAKRIKLEETTKDKNDLANAVLKSLPNIKCKAFVRSSSKKSSVYTNVQNFKSKPDTKPIPNCILVDKITPKINTLPKDNDRTKNIIVQNDTLSSNLCYNDADNEILKRSFPKSDDTVATSTSIHGCGQGNKSNVFNSKGHNCVQKNELNNHVSDNGFSIKANSDNYIQHKRAKEKNLSCHICQYKCVQNSDLIRHIRTHTGEKPYICDFCDYKCSRKSDLKKHVTYKHTKEKHFSCHKCQYKCVEKGNLKKHCLQHAGEKPYTCDFCDYRCSNKSDLKRHLTYKHTKEKKFSCHICQYKCVEKGNLKKHYLKHTGEKPYICDLCDYRCVRKEILKIHIKHKHTKENT